MKLFKLLFAITLMLVVATAVAAPDPKITICHKYDTLDQATITISYNAVSMHLANHGDWHGVCPESDKFVDVDGMASPDSGIPSGIDVAVGDTLTDWPTGFSTAGIDWFDNDDSCSWTSGDDLHMERTGGCPTGISDGVHQVGADCVVLDLDASLYEGQQVEIDLESETNFTGNCPGTPPLLMFYDVDGDGYYSDGEDIVLDANANGVFD